MKRKLEVAVISDLHLGTFGCQAIPILRYLRNIDPKILVLNGDIINIWQFNKKNFPSSHILVINELLEKAIHGTKIIYLIGNHDDALRRFTNYNMGNISLRNQLELHINGKKHWFFHGDVFDASIMVSPWLAKLGGQGYDFLIRMNHWVNKMRMKSGSGQMSFAHKVKSSVKKAVKFIQDFEAMAIQLAAEKGFDFVICGHIHQPQIKKVETNKGIITYLNSGDWIENLTALEFYGNQWHLYRYDDIDYKIEKVRESTEPISELREEIPKKVEPRITKPTLERLLRESKKHLLL